MIRLLGLSPLFDVQTKNIQVHILYCREFAKRKFISLLNSSVHTISHCIHHFLIHFAVIQIQYWHYSHSRSNSKLFGSLRPTLRLRLSQVLFSGCFHLLITLSLPIAGGYVRLSTLVRHTPSLSTYRPAQFFFR